MNNIILILIVIAFGAIGVRSLYKTFKGESGCSCGKDKNGSCKFKDKCGHK